jgi:hypothetical protein
MDVEKQLFGTTLGMDKKTGNVRKSGYKSHIVAINEIWKAGSIRQAIEKGILKGGILYECVKNNVPFVIGGSIRDDGPLPDTITDVIKAQDEMRKYIRKADMCIICASMLHGIAVGNMLPLKVEDCSSRHKPLRCNKVTGSWNNTGTRSRYRSCIINSASSLGDNTTRRDTKLM